MNFSKLLVLVGLSILVPLLPGRAWGQSNEEVPMIEGPDGKPLSPSEMAPISTQNPSSQSQDLPVLVMPDGTRFATPETVTFSKPLTRLTSATTIVADVVQIDGVIVTQGHPLRIVCRRLIFSKAESKILAFDTEAPATTVVPPTPPQAAAVADHLGQGNYPSGPHHDGYTGRRGTPGLIGPPEAAIPGLARPGEIFIYARTVDGIANISGTGQKGGKGASGGTGGQGGNGSKGQKANSNKFNIENCYAGNGGKGGRGGKGGEGGKGGKGGAPAKVVFFTEDPVRAKVHSDRAPGGDGGEPGASGPGGGGGPGGDADDSILGKHMPPGERGAAGDPYPRKAAQGKQGDLGSDVTNSIQLIDLTELKSRREQVLVSWQRFHHNRLLEMLINDSVRLSSFRVDLTREMVSSTPDWKLFYDNLDREFFESVKTAWQTVLQGSAKNDPRFTQLLASLESNSDPRSLLAQLQISFDLTRKSTLDALTLAAAACAAFNSTVSAILDGPLAKEYFSLKDIYEIPVCMGQPDLARTENYLADISLGKKLPSAFQVDPQVVVRTTSADLGRDFASRVAMQTGSVLRSNALTTHTTELVPVDPKSIATVGLGSAASKDSDPQLVALSEKHMTKKNLAETISTLGHLVGGGK